MSTTATVPPVETFAPDLKTRVEPGALGGAAKLFLGAGVVGLLASLAGFFMGEETKKQFLFSYLTSYMFVLSLALGSMFFVLAQHLTRAGWSVVVRRVSENLMGAMPVLAVLFIPIAIGYHDLFHHWVDADPADTVLAGKSGYLNVPFFFTRVVIYFVVWSGIAVFFRRTSLKQDETGDPALTLRMARVAAPCMLLFALTLTFAAIDWMMSLDPHWFSTIWGVYYFAGSFLSAMSLLGVLLMWMQGKGILAGAVNTEHYHDVGKLMFAFVVFWTYIAISQYMLIWYANLPEETWWYHHHLEGGWRTVGDALIFGHFAIPFVFLMSRHVKRTRATLAIAAIAMMVMHWVDLHWVVMPTLHHHGLHPSWLDATTLIGVLGIFLWVFLGNLQRTPLMPVRDPRLAESLKFVNH